MEFIKSPLGIAILMLASSISGAMFKDRLNFETRDTAAATRIDAVERRLDDIRQDLHDMKMQIADSMRQMASEKNRR